MLVIGLVDNVLRPILVGKETRLPDYVVLVATLGGLAVFGLNGFVIGPVIAAMFIVAWDIFAEVAAGAAGEQGSRGAAASLTRVARYLARLVLAAGASLSPESACMPWAMPISTPLASAA